MSILPAQIGPYTITREIGPGGMGVVYLVGSDRARHNPRLYCSMSEHGL
jgi:hypothetical protein